MIQVRMLINAGHQVVVPIIAGLDDYAHEEVASIYRRSCCTLRCVWLSVVRRARRRPSGNLRGPAGPLTHILFFGILLAAGGFMTVLSMPRCTLTSARGRDGRTLSRK